MKNIFVLAVLLYLVYKLANDFNRDKGRNKKSKLIHSLFLISFTLMYSSSFYYLGTLLTHLADYQAKFDTPIGLLPGPFRFFSVVASVILGCFAVYFALKMAGRDVKAKNIFFKLLPYLALLESIFFYQGFVSEDHGFEMNHLLVFILGFIFFAGIAIVISLVYKEKSMREFFEFKNETINQIK